MSLLARAFAVAFSPGMVTGPAAYMTKKQKQKRSKKSRKSAVAKELEKQDKKLLALRLKLRRPREELVSQGIMPPLKSSPGFHEQRQRLERAKVGDSLQRKIRLRPEKSHLVNQHILADTHVDPLVNATQQRLKRSRLEQDLDSKIKNRPGPLELIEGNILKTENMLVEQAVKDGKVKFLKTNSLDIGPYEFDEDSQEGFSDEALSPSQSDVSQAESQLSRGSLPSAQSSSAFADHSKTLQQQQQQLQQQQKQQQQRSSVSSPSQLLSPKAGQTFVTIKQEPGLISPPPITSNSFTPISAVSNITLSSGSGKVTPSPRQPRKKQTKRPKPKEIKFHEYKPPNEQSSKPQQASTVSNPYNLLLMQQQLYLQLQLLQQQQLILPNTANQKQNTASASSSNTSVTSTHTTSNPTATTTAAAGAAVPTAPATPPVPVTVKQQPDVKPNIAALQGKPRGLSNLEDMKVSELKLELKNRGLHVSGTKPQLVERLRPYVEQQVTTSATSPNEVSTTTVTSSTRVSSSTDLDVPFSETASTAQGSLSTPPVSPEYRSSFSVTSEPMSPGSAFDPMSPPTFQNVLTTPVCSPDTVSTTNQQTMSGSGRDGSPFDQTMPTLESPQPLPPASSILPVDILNSDNTTQDMMDVSSLDTNTTGSQISNDLLLQQQLKIQELERMLQLSQMQLQMQQLQQPNMSPLSLSQSSTQQHQQQQQSPAGKTTTLSPQQLQPEGKPSAFMFHSKDFAHTLNQQPKVFSFATPPPNGQPFLFSKQQSPDTQSIALPNGMVASKAASLPSSPTERNVLGIGSGMTRSVTQPTFANPPPNYEEAVRQVKERKSQGNTPVNGSPVGSPPKGNIANSDPRSTKCQDLDDLLEVLVDHGYQIPITPKFRDMQRTLHNSTGGLTTITHSVVRGRGGSIDLKLPVPGPSPPPPMTHSYPSTDLPMEVDPTDLNISSLDLGDTTGGGGMARGERTGRTLSAPFDIPMTTIDACETSMDTGKDVGASGSTNPDNDLNWLDLVIPSSASGLTPVSATPPTFNMDGAFGATLGKDPFPLNLLDLNDISTPTDLHHLEDDVWDNIPIAE